MKYIADVLTLLRLVLAFVIFFLVINDYWLLATILFVVGVLTDAFDGIAARRWPYSDAENQRLWYRRNAHDFDNLSDSLLAFGALLGLSIAVPFWWLVTVFVVAGSIMIKYAIDRYSKTDLRKAERIDVMFGWLYGALLAAMLGYMTVRATDNWETWFVVYGVLGVGMLYLKRDRLTGRPEVTYGKK